MTSREVKSAVENLQRQSGDLARANLGADQETRPFHDTTTVAVRLLRSDAEAINALANEQGVPVSTLLRSWITTGLREEQGDSVEATLNQLEQGIRLLRKQVR